MQQEKAMYYWLLKIFQEGKIFIVLINKLI